MAAGRLQRVLTNPVSCWLYHWWPFYTWFLARMFVLNNVRGERTSTELWQSKANNNAPACTVNNKNCDFYNMFDAVSWHDLTHLSQAYHCVETQTAWCSSGQVSFDASQLKQYVSKSSCSTSCCVNSRQQQSAGRLFLFLHAACLLSLTWLLWPWLLSALVCVSRPLVCFQGRRIPTRWPVECLCPAWLTHKRTAVAHIA